MLAMYMFSFSPLDTSKFTSLSALYSTMSNVWCFYIHGCWFIHWSMINLTGTISLEKTKSSFSIHQLLITFYLKTGIHEPLHPPFSTCSSHIQRILFYACLLQPYFLKYFLSPFQWFFSEPVLQNVLYVPFWTELTINTYFLYINQLSSSTLSAK